MKPGSEAMVVVLILAGAATAAVGTLSSTGVWDIGLGRGWALAGLAVIAACMVYMEFDIHRNSAELGDADLADACRKALGSAPDDGYIVDLTALGEVRLARRPRADEPYVLDLTEGGRWPGGPSTPAPCTACSTRPTCTDGTTICARWTSPSSTSRPTRPPSSGSSGRPRRTGAATWTGRG